MLGLQHPSMVECQWQSDGLHPGLISLFAVRMSLAMALSVLVNLLSGILSNKGWIRQVMFMLVIRIWALMGK